jgi:hypothetical protein
MTQTPLQREFTSRDELVTYLHREFADIVGDDTDVALTRGGRQAALRQLATINPPLHHHPQRARWRRNSP